jgi:hypothetical protein
MHSSSSLPYLQVVVCPAVPPDFVMLRPPALGGLMDADEEVIEEPAG